MTVYRMKKQTKPRDRAANRIRKTIPFPDALADEIQAIADEKYAGDFTRTVLEEMARRFPSAREFLRTNTTSKFSTKK
jgi:hypothetical protein